MRAVSANLLALLFLCTCASVFYVWSTLEEDNRLLERYKRGLRLPGTSGPSTTADLSTKTFRALLAVVPAAAQQPLPPGHAGSSRRATHHNNLTQKTVSSQEGNRYRRVSVDDNEDSVAAAQRVNQPEEDSSSSPVVEDGIFWSAWLEEDHLQRHVGFTEDRARAWRERARASRVVKLEPGCGRRSNQLATFHDGAKACVRYGINADQVQGETLTYYLATLLGLTNVPPLALSQLSGGNGGGGDEQWASVRRRIGGLQWSEGAVVSLTEWVSNLTGVVTPAPLRQEQQGGGLHPPRVEELWRNATASTPRRRRQQRQLLEELMQWSDLIAFDYLSANFDRLASNLFSRQWDSRVMERDTNNLLRTPHGQLVFVDNEAGLVHGYRVLGAWEKYHAAVLGSVCVFRRGTAQRVAELHRGGDAASRLLELYREREPFLSAVLGFLSEEHARVLQERIRGLHKHILHCEAKYSRL